MTSVCGWSQKAVELFASVSQMQSLKISGFHYTVKIFSHFSLHFKIMNARTYPFATNKCSFWKQLLQLKSLTPSICLSSSAVMVEGSHEQSATSFMWGQPAKFVCQKANLTYLLDLELLTKGFMLSKIQK